MVFTINCTRDIVGYRIDVEVRAEAEESIESVRITFDDFELANDFLSPPQSQYQNTFSQVGGYTPGVQRTVVVTATNDAQKQKTASKQWQD